MPLGHSSNVRIAGVLYHVQTEDHGPHRAFFDTTVYCQGRVLHRRSTDYHDLLEMGPDLPSFLAKLLEEQHRGVVEEIRKGTLELAPAEVHSQKP
jgi:hypothetical protein